MIFSIIATYLRRQTLLVASAIVFMILFIILGNAFAVVLSQSGEQNLSISNIISLVVIKGISELPIIITLAIGLGITLIINKLYKDSEISAVQNAGMGNISIYRSLLPLLISVSIINLALSTMLLPQLNQLQQNILISSANTTDFNFIKQHTFQNFKGGGIIVYTSSQTKGADRLGNTFLYDAKNDTLILSDAISRTHDTSNKVFAQLERGKRYTGLIAKESTIAEFDNLQMQVFTAANNRISAANTIKETPTTTLIHSKNPKFQAELGWRLAMSISIFIIAVLAIHFGKSKPRAKYNFSLLYTLMFFIAYISVLKSVKGMVEQGEVSVIMLYVVHLIVAMLATSILVWQPPKRSIFLRRTTLG